MVVMIGAFGNRELITPLASQIPALLAKTASCKEFKDSESFSKIITNKYNFFQV